MEKLMDMATWYAVNVLSPLLSEIKLLRAEALYWKLRYEELEKTDK
jgi:hypothetical protein